MNNKAHLRPKDFDSNGDIIPMACKEEKGDLISRKGLKEKVQEIVEAEMPIDEKWAMGLRHSLKLIDSAPTIPLPDFKDGYKQAILDGKTQYQRPKGRMIIKQPSGWEYCSECGKVLEPQDKFCWNCGADMRGDTE